MIELNCKYTSSDTKSPSCLTYLDEYFIIETPFYKGGKATKVEYSSVKSISSSRGNLCLKILRTNVEISGFSTEFVNVSILVIRAGQQGEVSKTKEWKKYKSAAEKRERREERKEKVAESVSNMKIALSNSVTSWLDDKEEKKAKSWLEKSLTDTTLQSGDTEVEMTKKIQLLFTAYLNAKNNDNLYDEDIEALFNHLTDTVQEFGMTYPNSDYYRIASRRLNKLTAEVEKKNRNDRVYMIIAIIAIIAYIIGDYLFNISAWLKSIF